MVWEGFFEWLFPWKRGKGKGECLCQKTGDKDKKKRKTPEYNYIVMYFEKTSAEVRKIEVQSF